MLAFVLITAPLCSCIDTSTARFFGKNSSAKNELGLRTTPRNCTSSPGR